MGQIRIRKYRAGDEDAIKLLIDEILEEYGIGVSESMEEDLNNIPEYYGKGGGFWVLVDGERIVGMIGLRRLSDDDCYFSRFYIHKNYRGKGWGSKLWHHREKVVKKFGYKKAYCNSHHKLKDALHFYEMHGYKRIKKPRIQVRWSDMSFVKDLS